MEACLCVREILILNDSHGIHDLLIDEWKRLHSLMNGLLGSCTTKACVSVLVDVTVRLAVRLESSGKSLDGSKIIDDLLNKLKVMNK